MGVTGHMAYAFDPEHRDAVAALFVGGTKSDGNEKYILSYPDFALIREDYGEVHFTLEALAVGNPPLAAVGTIVYGADFLRELGNGGLYFFSAEDLRLMTSAYRDVTPETLAKAIEAIGPQFDPQRFGPVPGIITEKFDIVRAELKTVSDNGWAMIGGVF